MSERPFSVTCPLPLRDYPQITLAHGGGGRMMKELIEQLFVTVFDNEPLRARHDAAVSNLSVGRIAFTTDSYVVRPLFFPGGDIGSLAVNGTINDLAMAGARPLQLSCGFILEEGLKTETLCRVVESMRQAADRAGVQIVTGDTKVVDRGKGDGIYINTAGIGNVPAGREVSPQRVTDGDAIIISGDVGRHGIAVMAEREGLAFETTIASDCATLACSVEALFDAGIDVHCLRDLTRGGLGAALIELAETSKCGIETDEKSIPVDDQVRGACEILGLDPLFVACEGRFIAFVAAADAEQALSVLRSQATDTNPSLIGHVTTPGASEEGIVSLQSVIGTRRILDLPGGEQLPRIC
jgi:hydrogenase expression/formation protein HypE